MINTFMKIKDITNISDLWDHIDSQLNPEAKANREENINSSPKSASVESKPERVPVKYRYTTKPSRNTPQSPGFRGRESARRRSGLEYHPYRRLSDPKPLPGE